MAENDFQKAIDLVIQVEKITSDILKDALKDLLSGKAEKKGKMTERQLSKKSASFLEDMPITEQNIGDFLKVARKYDVDFSLKCDKSTSPPTYHVFFSAAKTKDFNRAFNEYAKAVDEKLQKRGEFTREQLKRDAVRIEKQPRKHKVREKTRENER